MKVAVSRVAAIVCALIFSASLVAQVGVGPLDPDPGPGGGDGGTCSYRTCRLAADGSAMCQTSFNFGKFSKDCDVVCDGQVGSGGGCWCEYDMCYSI